jgi:transcriptional regulator with XRE-family HTH domain
MEGVIMFGDRLKLLRTEKNMTQLDLSKLLKVSPSTIGMYEQNRREPDASTIKIIADYFNVSVDYLMDLTDIRESAEKILNNNNSTIAFHRHDGYEEDLPPEAIEEIEKFKEFIRHKYGKK